MVWISPVKPYEEHDADGKEALHHCWYYGDLRYKLDPNQEQLYDQINEFFGLCTNSFERLFITEWSRRNGKDFTWLCFVLEQMRRNKKHIYYYGTAIEKDLERILIPLLDVVQADCPEPMKLKARRSKGEYVDPITESMLFFVGLDINPNGIRGQGTKGVIITEYSYCNRIDEAETAMVPMLVEDPKAWRAYNSTPGESTGHKWHTEVVPRAKKVHGGKGYNLRILDECPRFLKSQIDAAYAEFGGRNTTKSRREYRCEHVGEETRLIIPEWIDAKDECLVDEYEMPEFYCCYTSMDPGQVDLHGNVFAGYDWDNDMLVVQSAYTMRAPKTSEIADSIKKTEKDLWDKVQYWRNYRFCDNPVLRVTDIDLRLVKDLAEEYDLIVNNTRRDDLRSAANALRKRIKDCKIRIIKSTAGELAMHLDAGIWDDKRKKFEHVSDVLGHFDLIAALIYLHRNIDLSINPYPPEPKREGVLYLETEPKLSHELSKFAAKHDKLGIVIDGDSNTN